MQVEKADASDDLPKPESRLHRPTHAAKEFLSMSECTRTPVGVIRREFLESTAEGMKISIDMTGFLGPGFVVIRLAGCRFQLAG